MAIEQNQHIEAINKSLVTLEEAITKLKRSSYSTTEQSLSNERENRILRQNRLREVIEAELLSSSYKSLLNKSVQDERLQLLANTLELACKLISNPAAITSDELEKYKPDLEKIAQIIDESDKKNSRSYLVASLGLASSFLLTAGLSFGVLFLAHSGVVPLLPVLIPLLVIGIAVCAYFSYELVDAALKPRPIEYENIHVFFAQHQQKIESNQNADITQLEESPSPSFQVDL